MMNQEETDEMRLLNGFSDGLSDGFMHWVLQLSKTHHLLVFWRTLELLIAEKKNLNHIQNKVFTIYFLYIFFCLVVLIYLLSKIKMFYSQLVAENVINEKLKIF